RSIGVLVELLVERFEEGFVGAVSGVGNGDCALGRVWVEQRERGNQDGQARTFGAGRFEHIAGERILEKRLAVGAGNGLAGEGINDRKEFSSLWHFHARSVDDQ